jgi:hypothetical protein
MAKEQDPVTLDLAPLPREQMGPFLLLGVDKGAGAEEIEAGWAQRVIWARKKQVSISLADINWAREVLNDPERRVKADPASLNVDTAEGVLRGLEEGYGVAGPRGRAWRPLEDADLTTDYPPPLDLPCSGDVRAAIVLPEPPCTFPAAERLLREYVGEVGDPWSLANPLDSESDEKQ